MAAQQSKDVEALESCLPITAQEKDSLRSTTNFPASHRRQRSRLAEKMPRARNVLLAVLACFMVTFGLATATASRPRQEAQDVDGDAQQGLKEKDSSAFSSLLNSASAEALHDLLHRYFPHRYQHGVWPSEHSALEAVHRDDAPLATSIAQLAKRQDTNVTVTMTSTTLVQASESATETSQGPCSVDDNDNVYNISLSDDNGEDDDYLRRFHDLFNLVTLYFRGGTTTLATTSRSQGSSSSSSYSPHLVTSTFTSTLPGGEVSIVTATSYVAAGSAASDAASTTRPSGSLQTNAAASWQRSGVVDAVLGAVIGGVLMI
ncbi:hypothetical protein NKR23_g6311 [Pleurostoma richardsiae]|uniref:Uncharacterized protein n=1 Tax=Pleurostoma richardsiae TaxID=41990 RepID=A0AA38VSL4_9PEZI|nr:hypothetical protein NKR23_g6311 [Pleurostoma richardsiae]